MEDICGLEDDVSVPFRGLGSEKPHHFISFLNINPCEFPSPFGD